MTYSTAQSINETRRLSDEQRKATLEYLKNKEEELRVLRETEAKKMAEENRGWENRSAVIRKDYFKALDNLRDKEQGDHRERPAGHAVDCGLARAWSLPTAAPPMPPCELSRTRRIGGVTLESQASDKLFKDRLDMLYGQEDAERRADATLRRSWDLEAQGLKALGNAQTQEDVQRGAGGPSAGEVLPGRGHGPRQDDGQHLAQVPGRAQHPVEHGGQIKAEKQLEQLQARGAKAGGRGRQGAAAARHDEEPDEGHPGGLQAFDKHGASRPASWLRNRPGSPRTSASSRSSGWAGKRSKSPICWPSIASAPRDAALEGGVSQAEVEKLLRPRRHLPSSAKRSRRASAPCRYAPDGDDRSTSGSGKRRRA